MAAFTYQKQHPYFHLDSLFMSNNCFINPIYFPSMPDSSSVQIDNVQLIGEKIEPCMSDKTKQISTIDTPTSSIVVDLEGDDQVIHSQEKNNPPMEKKKMKNLSCFDSAKDVKQRSKPKKQRKCDLEVKEEKKSKVDNKKKKKKDDDDVNAAEVLADHKQTDYVHVRARRGQANDSHSLAERVRREKISERLKMLQSLVPGCDNVNSKAHMLEEIINYVQSLQLQVEMLSMKLAYMNPIYYDFGVDLDYSTLATSSPLSLTTTHQDSMTHAPTTTSTTTTTTEFVNDTSVIPLHENSVSFSPLQQEVQQQKLNDFCQVLLQQQQEQELPNNEELLCYMDYYHLHHRQEGATNLFYYE